MATSCSNLPFVSPSRFVHSQSGSYYYGFGNTPPEYLLEDVSDPSPSVLVLGCGDLRSCLYTLWKSFSRKRVYEGVEFHLNDLSSAIIARNVLFLFLIMKKPPSNEIVQLKKWIAAIWAIWYCHDLLEEHKKIFDECLNELLEISKDEAKWRCHPVGRIVEFDCKMSLVEVRNVWTKWLHFSILLKTMHYERLQVQTAKLVKQQSIDLELDRCLKTFLGTHSVGNEIHMQLKREIRAYYITGNTYAESLLGIPCSSDVKYVNSSLFENDDCYSLHYSSIPFKSYSFLEESRMRNTISDSTLLSCSSNDSLLANCLHQFIEWISSIADIFESECQIKFIMANSDALRYAFDLHNKDKKFDNIFTSNLMDPLSLPAVLFTLVPLLKDGGSLHTSSLLCSGYGLDYNAFIMSMFGIPLKMLPKLFGISCSSISATNGGMVVFIWKALVRAQALNIDHVDKKLSSLLLECVRTSSLSYTEYVIYPRLISKSVLCVQTAIAALTCFKQHATRSNATNCDFAFWNNLSKRILEEPSLKSYLLHFQTLAFIQGIHIHLAVSNADCPICTGQPLNSYICQLETTVHVGSTAIDQVGTSYFYPLFIHKKSLDTEYLGTKCHNLLDFECDDFYVFDSNVCKPVAGESKIAFTLFIPCYLLKESYQLTISKSNVKTFIPINMQFCDLNVICSLNISDLKTKSLMM